MYKTVLKRTLTCIAAIAIISLMLSVLTACSPNLNGIYTRTTEEGNLVVYTFSGNNQVQFEGFRPDGDTITSRTTTYKLNKDTIVFSDWSDGYEGKELEIRIKGNSFFLGPNEVEFKKK